VADGVIEQIVGIKDPNYTGYTGMWLGHGFDRRTVVSSQRGNAGCLRPWVRSEMSAMSAESRSFAAAYFRAHNLHHAPRRFCRPSIFLRNGPSVSKVKQLSPNHRFLIALSFAWQSR
jgi:hypothetical protein